LELSRTRFCDLRTGSVKVREASGEVHRERLGRLFPEGMPHIE